MKKYLITAILVLAIAACTCCLFACKTEEQVTKIEKITATLDSAVSYSVGDKFDTDDITMVAELSDDTKTTITSTATITYDKSGLDLDEKGKFTTVGEKTLVIYYLAHKVELTINVAA